MSSWARTLSRLDAFSKVDSTYQARSSSGGFLSVVVLAAMLLMVASELRDFLRYRQTHEFAVDADMQQTLQVNFAMTVAMSCALMRVDVLDASGTRRNLDRGISMQSVSRRRTFAATHGGRTDKLNDIADMHVHDIIAEAGRSRRVPGVHDKSVAKINKLDDAACRIEGSAAINKVAGLFHITAHGHGYGGAYVPSHLMNFTHYIDELSFGPLYPSLDNPLDNTLHMADDHVAAFRYFISVVPTTYIDASAHRLSTSQYAVKQYYKPHADLSDLDGKPPGIFLEYSFEPIAVTVREHRGSVVAFAVRLCAAVSGLFVAVGIAHWLLTCCILSSQAALGEHTRTPQGILDTKRLEPVKSGVLGAL
ncbi:hypothetical protein LPJ63_002628 [Coemansia sp. RSA 2711]|nr:hypothetical protein LPJ63_002628 [Coemansia sp. RSA 2711]KAJ2301227.1 hypothetical protein IWW54_006253 [Coemansia sp. RSA 2705]KAJ2313876.1 hypothetical protein IWW52_004442 [Coemansia sp. RSA 2704]KAJ2362438.1 hypothetical protein H4S01_004780 [Coemansia sp. RSA 2610]KAJ2716630.1 hypothetical protein H4R23_005424 [Coemansia sp. Cherry 401B]